MRLTDLKTNKETQKMDNAMVFLLTTNKASTPFIDNDAIFTNTAVWFSEKKMISTEVVIKVEIKKMDTIVFV